MTQQKPSLRKRNPDGGWVDAATLLADIEARLETASDEATMAWHKEDHDRIMARYRNEIIEHIEAWHDATK